MRVSSAAMRVAVTVLAIGALTACRDVGLEGNLPRAEAENRQLRYAVYEASGMGGSDATVLTFEDRHWMAGAESIPVPDRLMQSVGSAGGVELFAPVWSAAPHARLYSRGEAGTWHPVTPVL